MRQNAKNAIVNGIWQLGFNDVSATKLKSVTSLSFDHPFDLEMQCCDEVTVESFGGILECHPYVLGEYRRIGQCGGRSFYQVLISLHKSK